MTYSTGRSCLQNVVTQEPDFWSAYFVAVWAAGAKWKGDVNKLIETSPSPFSSTVSPPRGEDGLYKIWPLPGICYGAKVDGPHL